MVLRRKTLTRGTRESCFERAYFHPVGAARYTACPRPDRAALRGPSRPSRYPHDNPGPIGGLRVPEGGHQNTRQGTPLHPFFGGPVPEPPAAIGEAISAPSQVDACQAGACPHAGWTRQHDFHHPGDPAWAWAVLARQPSRGLARDDAAFSPQPFRSGRYGLHGPRCFGGSLPVHRAHRLFPEIIIESARAAEARAGNAAAREGKPSTEWEGKRELLRRIQRRPRSRQFRRKMSERVRRHFDLVGPFRRWTPEQLVMIGTMPDREVARRIDGSPSAVRAKKFSQRRPR